jgi:hypothetical protein
MKGTGKRTNDGLSPIISTALNSKRTRRTIYQDGNEGEPPENVDMSLVLDDNGIEMHDDLNVEDFDLDIGLELNLDDRDEQNLDDMEEFPVLNQSEVDMEDRGLFEIYSDAGIRSQSISHNSQALSDRDHTFTTPVKNASFIFMFFCFNLIFSNL